MKSTDEGHTFTKTRDFVHPVTNAESNYLKVSIMGIYRECEGRIVYSYFMPVCSIVFVVLLPNPFDEIRFVAKQKS